MPFSKWVIKNENNKRIHIQIKRIVFAIEAATIRVYRAFNHAAY